MSKKKQLIIPIFIPFGGCTHQCVFCNQAGITGRDDLPSTSEIPVTIEEHLGTWRGTGRREVAFYGGSFTGLSEGAQRAYLEVVKPYLDDNRIDGIRLSTRPDYISPTSLALLKEYGVETVELGLQSMDDKVLKLSGRGHLASDTVSAVELLKSEGFTVGLQLMPGLPGDTAELAVKTAKEAIKLAPDFVRVYPTLVIKDTPLFKLYERGDYEPWELEDMVSVCKEILSLFKEAGIKVIRVGLQTTEELRRDFVAGPMHPSFRQLIES